MTRRTRWLAVLFLVVAPASAAADDVQPFRDWSERLRERPARFEGSDVPSVADCVAAATDAQAELVCEEYAALVAIHPAARVADASARSLRLYAEVDPADLGSGMGQAFIDDGNACNQAIDAALAAGARDDIAVTIDDAKLTLAEAKVKVCDATIAFGTKLTGDIADAHAAARAEIAAKYEKVGIKGQRLELFIEYDDVYWRGKRCERVTDLKKLAKAKVLFQWLENADGTHTIRTYTFKGHRVKSVKDRTYATEAKAWKGCQ
jgi:hypothetical protein